MDREERARPVGASFGLKLEMFGCLTMLLAKGVRRGPGVHPDVFLVGCFAKRASLLCLLFLQELRSWAPSAPFLGALPTPGCLNTPLTPLRCSQVGLQRCMLL